MFGRKTNYWNYSLFLLLGGVIGAGVALLFAPMPGRKLQKQLKNVIDEQVENVQTAVRKVVNA
jgi:gas vesicle protein